MSSRRANRFTDAGLSEATTYAYAIFAKSGRGTSRPLTGVVATLDVTPPRKVAGLTAVTGRRAITLSWRPSRDADFAGVAIRRLEGNRAPTASTGTLLTRRAVKRRTFADSTVTPGTRYSYAVFAQDSSGNVQRRPATVVIVTTGPQDTAAELLPFPATSDRSSGAMQNWGVAEYDPAAKVATLHARIPGDTRGADRPRTSKNPVTMPVTAASGIYEARWRQRAANQRALITISAKPAAPTSDVAVIVPDFTWAAYNRTGGGSLYANEPAGGVALLRPMSGAGAHAGRPTRNPIRFITAKHRAPDVIAQSDLHEFAADYDLSAYKLIVLYGHDEYWTARIRNEVEGAVVAGANLLNMSGNTAWWATKTNGSTIKPTDLWHNLGRPGEVLLGGNFRFAGYPVRPVNSGVAYDQQAYQTLLGMGLPADVPFTNSLGMLKGFRVLDGSDPLFAGTGLRDGEWFGYAAQANDVETDGYPLLPTGRPDTQAADGFIPVGLDVLAEAWNWRSSFHHSAPLLRHRVGKGTVITLGSIGWTGALLAEDPHVRRITANALRELLSTPG